MPQRQDDPGVVAIMPRSGPALAGGTTQADVLRVLRAVHDPLPGADAPVLVDDEIAQRFTEQTKLPGRKPWIHVAQRNRWYGFSAPCWREDGTLEIYDEVRRFIREHAQGLIESAEPDKREVRRREAKAVRTARVVAAVVTLLRGDREHAVEGERLDADPMLLATPGGVVDLTTGIMRPGSPDDLITKCTAIAPGGNAPTWLEFLDVVTDGDAELVGFLHRLVGYCLTGRTDEHVLAFLWGSGANGKSTFTRVLQHIFGDYGCTAPAETFLEAHGERHPTELAMLNGRRLVVAQELDDGRQWALARIKAITGGDPITARYMRGDFFTFPPTFKLVIAANHRPGLRNVDEAMRRRLRLVPFTVTIPPGERDPHLFDRLVAEAEGILAWAIEGCLQWQREGLNAPARVLAATDDYLQDEDTLATWLAERTERCDEDTGSAELYADYGKWIEARGEHATSSKRFSRALEDRGIEKIRNARGMRFRRLRLLPKDALL